MLTSPKDSCFLPVIHFLQLDDHFWFSGFDEKDCLDQPRLSRFHLKVEGQALLFSQAVLRVDEYESGSSSAHAVANRLKGPSGRLGKKIEKSQDKNTRNLSKQKMTSSNMVGVKLQPLSSDQESVPLTTRLQWEVCVWSWGAGGGGGGGGRVACVRHVSNKHALQQKAFFFF